MLVELVLKNEKIVVIIFVMFIGSFLKYMMDVFFERVFDVGIVE